MNEENFVSFEVENLEESVFDIDDLYQTCKSLRQIKEPYRTKVINALANKSAGLPNRLVQQSDIDGLKEEFGDQVEGIEQYFEL